MPIKPQQGLGMLQRVLCTVPVRSAARVLGGLDWQAILRAPSRQKDTFYKEFEMQQARGMKMQPAAAPDLRTPGRLSSPRQEILAEILQILAAVLGKAPDPNEPLMEVPPCRAKILPVIQYRIFALSRVSGCRLFGSRWRNLFLPPCQPNAFTKIA